MDISCPDHVHNHVWLDPESGKEYLIPESLIETIRADLEDPLIEAREVITEAKSMLTTGDVAWIILDSFEPIEESEDAE